MLTTKQAQSVPAVIVQALSAAGQVTGIVLSLASKANATTATVLTVASSIMPAALSIARGAIPSTAGFTAALMAAPVTLPPGAAVTKTVFAARPAKKAPTPAPVTAVIQ
jgi:hypothetical protein